MQFTYNIPPNLARALPKGTVSIFFSPKTLSVQLIQVTWGGGNIQSMVKELMAPSVHLVSVDVRVGFVGVYVIRVCHSVWEWGWWTSDVCE